MTEFPDIGCAGDVYYPEGPECVWVSDDFLIETETFVEVPE